MAQFTIFKLHFTTPLHIGLGRTSYDSSASDLRSDTLSAALAAFKAQHGATSQEIRCFLDSFVLSSAFPFEGNRYFLPKPLHLDRILIDGKEDVTYRKMLKSIRFIESSVWKDFIHTEKPTISASQIHGEFVTVQNDNDFTIPYQKQVIQRVAVSRNGEDPANPFFFEWGFFDGQHDAGLFFIADATQSVIQELEVLLKELGETGIGTDKTVGGGQFVVSKGIIELPSEQGNAWLSLSLYIPTPEEQKQSKLALSFYNILQRGGYMAGSTNNQLRHLWKKSIYMFEEGSVFCIDAKPQGQIADLQPAWNSPEMHPVYRSGKALFVPIKLSDV